jgi:hypothetical protein
MKKSFGLSILTKTVEIKYAPHMFLLSKLLMENFVVQVRGNCKNLVFVLKGRNAKWVAWMAEVAEVALGGIPGRGRQKKKMINGEILSIHMH